MAVFGLVALGIILGAAGTELLRAKKPELLEKIEGRAKHLVDILSEPKPEEEAKEEVTEEAEAKEKVEEAKEEE